MKIIGRTLILVLCAIIICVQENTKAELNEIDVELSYYREALNEIQNNLNTVKSNEEIINKSNDFIKEKVKYYDIKSDIKAENFVLYDLPNYDTSFKAFMDYTTITDTTTEQWELQQKAYTDEYGLRKINDDYCVALGSYYSDTVGDRFKITLENGSEFTVIVADLKQDIHTDWKNQYTPVYCNGELYSCNVIEFLVDKYALHDMVSILGTIDYYEQFEGNIAIIEKIETTET